MSLINAYVRGFHIVRALPLLFALPVAAEFLQHVAEIRLGMYAGPIDGHAQGIRLAFGAAKILALFLTLLVALRWWSFEGDLSRALRPSWRLAGSLLLIILVQIAGDLVAMGIGRAILAAIGEASRGVRIAATVGPLLGWLFVAGLLLPWYVALLVEDRAVTLCRSVAIMRGRLIRTFGLLIAGFLPLMIVHYALGFGAMGRTGPLLWSVMIIDAGVVGQLVAMLAALYFEIFDGAKRLLDRP